MDVPTYCLSRPEVREDCPFGPDVTAYRVRSKIFALYSSGGRDGGLASVNLKCEPAQALALRDIWDAVIPGYHMNKKHWNTVTLDGSVPDAELARMIDHSYTLVVRGLPKSERHLLELRHCSDQLYR